MVRATFWGLQPSEDRVAIGDWGKKLPRLQEVVSTMGRLAAWDQIRSAGRDGSACADALMCFSEGSGWVDSVMALADVMVKTTNQQWEDFRAARL